MMTTAIIVIIILFEWPKMKQQPIKDKLVFIVLLFIGWFLSMFDLPNMSGPLTWQEALFHPLRKFIVP
jgi:multisubunit Na+/H+ antiporter MnhB subunit